MPRCPVSVHSVLHYVVLFDDPAGVGEVTSGHRRIHTGGLPSAFWGTPKPALVTCPRCLDWLADHADRASRRNAPPT